MKRKVAIVVPCFNESERLDAEAVRVLSAAAARVILVDDGSSDGTGAMLGEVSGRLEGVEALLLGVNRGKAEAVRRGFLEALELGVEHVGFLDADMATPPEEMLRLVALARAGRKKVVVGSRVSMLGTRIARSHLRHYLGRVFATCASIVLDLDIYDTQCGAKLFADTPSLRAALDEPFTTRWAFDVELLGRLLYPLDSAVTPLRSDDMLEVPLVCWTDVPGSKVTPKEVVRVGAELARLAAQIEARRRARRC